MPHECTIRFGEETLVLHASGAVWHPLSSTLILADMHWGKGSFFARFGAHLPPYDAADTLQRIERLMQRYAPASVWLLGDSFHDAMAWQRLSEPVQAGIEALSAQCEWVWVEGNHDAAMLRDIPGCVMPECRLGSIRCLHQPDASAGAQMVGHFHPAHRLRVRRHTVKGRCFVVSHSRMIIPAFGTYTGGLSITDNAIKQALLTPMRACYMLVGEDIVPLHL